MKIHRHASTSRPSSSCRRPARLHHLHGNHPLLNRSCHILHAPSSPSSNVTARVSSCCLPPTRHASRPYTRSAPTHPIKTAIKASVSGGWRASTRPPVPPPVAGKESLLDAFFASRLGVSDAGQTGQLWLQRRPFNRTAEGLLDVPNLPARVDAAIHTLECWEPLGDHRAASRHRRAAGFSSKRNMGSAGLK